MLKQYYGRRAQEYEQIYQREDSVRQSEQAAIATAMQQALLNRRVLEVACGTGFWTKIAAQVTQHLVATDISPQMLAIAQQKGLPQKQVEFCEVDAYALASVPGTFDAGLANFWFSHVPKARIDKFLRGFHAKLSTGAIIFMADNIYVPGVGGEFMTRSGSEDTFKLRELSDGSKYEVLKNYYDAEQLRHILAPHASNLQVNVGRCFWWVSYVIRS